MGSSISRWLRRKGHSAVGLGREARFFALGLFALALCALSTGALRAEEAETPTPTEKPDTPAPVGPAVPAVVAASWDQIEAWALSREKVDSGKPEPIKGDLFKPDTPKGEGAKADPAKAGARKIPRSYTELSARASAVCKEKVTEALREREFRLAGEWAYRAEIYDQALAYFDRAKADARPGVERYDLALQRFWEVSLYAGRRPQAETAYKEWVERMKAALLNRKGEVSREALTTRLDDRQTFYMGFESLRDEVKDLEQKGDTDGDSLVALVKSLRPGGYYQPLRLLLTYCKLLEWYPEQEEVKSGWVPNRLLDFMIVEFSDVKSADALAEQYAKSPDFPTPKDAELLWLKIKMRMRAGANVRTTLERNDLYKEARAMILEYQRKFPKGAHNLGGVSSDCQQAKEKISAYLPVTTGRGG